VREGKETARRRPARDCLPGGTGAAEGRRGGWGREAEEEHGKGKGFGALFISRASLRVVLGWMGPGWIRMSIRISDFWLFFFDYGQIKYRIYYVNS